MKEQQAIARWTAAEEGQFFERKSAIDRSGARLDDVNLELAAAEFGKVWPIPTPTVIVLPAGSSRK